MLKTAFVTMLVAAIGLGSMVVSLPAWAQAGCTYPLGGSATGLVPRKASDNDLVCVTQSVADLIKKENADSARGVNHPPGSNGCVSGFVWREAFDGDSVCVTNARRSETWQQNLKAGVGSTGGQIKADAALLSAVNDARLHPEKYPPHVSPNPPPNTAKPIMTKCDKPLGESWALDTAATTHNKLVASVSNDVLAKDPLSVHRNPPPAGVLSWAPTGKNDQVVDLRVGPLVQAGYNWRGEIIAIGQATAALAVQFWMQDDESHNWDHRKAILTCKYTDAGAAHFVGGPLGHYWTVDLGAH
jgi:hypothetical protein